MRVLMLAAACSPYSGSEPYVGWLWARAAAERHEVQLIVADWCMPNLERARSEGMVPETLRITSAGKTRLRPPKNAFWARLYTWLQYREFLRDSRSLAGKFMGATNFDVVHQTTLATWRMGMPMAAGSLPSVWGPLGGGEQFPFGFLGLLSRSSKFYEIARRVLSFLAASSPQVRRAARMADVVISTNQDTDVALRKLGRHREILRCPMLLQQSRFNEIVAFPRLEKTGDTLRIFAGGGLDGRKGIAVSFEVLSLLKGRGLKFQFTVGGHGSELPYLRNRAAELGLDVRFRPDLKGEEYLRQLASTDVILFPSLRDNTALTLVEAAAAGAIPVVIALGGPGEFVTDEIGIKVPCGTAKQAVRDLAGAVERIASGKVDLHRMRDAARRRVRENYIEGRAHQILETAYGQAVTSPRA